MWKLLLSKVKKNKPQRLGATEVGKPHTPIGKTFSCWGAGLPRLCASSTLWLFFLFFSSCGYHWTAETPEGRPVRVSVPFISGDEQGVLTSEIISALSSSGMVRISSSMPEYRLQVCVLKQNNETIGFRRDRQKVHGGVKKNLLACEGRRVLEAEVMLRHVDTGEVAWGPYRLAADADYDYVDGDSIQDLTFVAPDGSPMIVLPFSLGQLESVESAQEAATQLLYRRLAKKIVDAFSAEW